VSADTATMGAPLTVRRMDRLEPGKLADLVEVLVACVDEGASLGFHAPLAPEIARAWWEQFPRDGVHLLVAERDGRIVGTVQMLDGESANGAHRGKWPNCWYTRRGGGRALPAP
jgi:acetyltransferase